MKRILIERLKEVRLNGEIINELWKGKVGIAKALIKNSKLHFHKKTHEWYFVLKGKGILTYNGKRIKIKKGDLIHIPPKVKHKVKGISKVEILVISFPCWRKSDHFLVQEHSNKLK